MKAMILAAAIILGLGTAFVAASFFSTSVMADNRT
jgi:hypothetical protein